MPEYKVLSPVTHGVADDEGNVDQRDYAAGEDIELTEEQAQPLLEAGVVTKGGDQELLKKQEQLTELEQKLEEHQAELQRLQQEVASQQQALSRDPSKEYGGLNASPEAATPRVPEGKDYNSLSRAELVKEAKGRGINAGGTRGDLVNRLSAHDYASGEAEAPEPPGDPSLDENAGEEEE